MKTLWIWLAILGTLGAHAQSPGVMANDTTIRFMVSGNCSICKNRIEQAAKDKGVIAATWDAETKILTLRYRPALVAEETIQQRIADAGHDTPLKKAKDEVYSKLPGCCLYRKNGPDGTSPIAGTENPDMKYSVMGVVMEEDMKGNLKALPGATILTDGTNKGIATDENGYFRVQLDKPAAVLTISYAGAQTQNIDVKPGEHLNIVLNTSTSLEGIRIVSTRRSTYISPLSGLRTQVMTERELYKAACCNLSESFETNPSVDVSYNDAVTGSKQIQLLGLSGNYTQLTVENMPGPRGIATPWGLNSIPGPRVESIQLTKGVGSVANGYESIAGQINVELKKPQSSERLFVNAYVNNNGKTDLNLNLARRVSRKWSTALLVHDAFLANKHIDFNKDGFRDLPTGNLFSLMNRWFFDNGNGWMGQAGVRILLDNKTGGQVAFDPGKDKMTANYYGLGIQTRRYEAFAKIGYVFPEKRYKSVGLQLSTFYHDQPAYFGTTVYNGTQRNFYANLIYQSIISNTNHKFRTGISFVADTYHELYRTSVYNRQENVPGAFFEYTCNHGEKFSLIAGLRGDYNNLFGFFATPRLHLRYEPVKGTVIRVAAGRGQRTANLFAENTGVLISSRVVNIIPAAGGKAYGLKPEVAWNEGVSIDQSFRLDGRSGSIGLDFFRTDFQQQVVVDVDQSARQVNFYNLSGKSFSNSFQATVNYALAKKLDIRLAYRLYDVRTTYHGELLEKPLLARHRGFVNLAWEPGRWKFDYTITFNGNKRLPYTGDNPPEYRLPAQSPGFIVMNAQVSRTLGKKTPVDFYAGCENIGNYYQRNAVLGADQPFSPYFDASLVWGPVSGRMFYAGFRYKIK